MSDIERRIRAYEKDADMDYIVLRDGSRFWFSREDLHKPFYLYWLTCLDADFGGEERPPVPDIFRAIADAKDREKAMSRVCPDWRAWRTGGSRSTAMDLDVLVEEGRIEPYSTVEYVYANSSPEE